LSGADRTPSGSRAPEVDARVVTIAGEHEDHYDPDFYIYNDVLVTHPSGELKLYGYPREVFPPTDFHSATTVGDRIVLIGCLGYPSQRRHGVTPVFALDTASLAITRLVTAGAAPGWIYEHTATLSDDGRSIVVRGGRCAVRAGGGGEEEIRENFDDWSLDRDTRPVDAPHRAPMGRLEPGARRRIPQPPLHPREALVEP